MSPPSTRTASPGQDPHETAAGALTEAEVPDRIAALERQIEECTARIEALTQEREAFVRSVAHDLRAPLHQIMGFVGMLTEECGPELSIEARRHLALVTNGAQRMAAMLDALVALARLDRKELHAKRTDLAAVAAAVVDQVRAASPDRQIAWRVGWLPCVVCDEPLMRDVFVRLCSNAVKFTRTREQAVIEIGTVPGSAPPAVFVRDNGVGFDSRNADRLFGVFQRLHRREDFEGDGVGLATVRRSVLRHGGRVWAESRPDEGATFYFTVPDVADRSARGDV